MLSLWFSIVVRARSDKNFNYDGMVDDCDAEFFYFVSLFVDLMAGSIVRIYLP